MFKFSICLNNLHFASKCTIEKAIVVVQNSESYQVISDCRKVIPLVNFPYTYIIVPSKNKCLKEPHFQVNIIMKLKDSRQLQFYENHVHKKVYDTFNCPEYLKNT